MSHLDPETTPAAHVATSMNTTSLVKRGSLYTYDFARPALKDWRVGVDIAMAGFRGESAGKLLLKREGKVGCARVPGLPML